MPVTSALKRKDQDAATDEKFRIEDRQREEARLREADGVEWKSRFFRPVDPSKGEEEELDWIIATHMWVSAILDITQGSLILMVCVVMEQHLKSRSNRF